MRGKGYVMSSYAPAQYGDVAVYNGGSPSTYAPTASEVAGTAVSALGQGGAFLQSAGVPVPPFMSTILGGAQVAGGALATIGAIVSVVGTEGVDLPVALPIILGGLQQVEGGIQQIQRAGSSGGFGLSPAQAAELAAADAQSAAAAAGFAGPASPFLTAIADAVWTSPEFISSVMGSARPVDFIAYFLENIFTGNVQIKTELDIVANEVYDLWAVGSGSGAGVFTALGTLSTLVDTIAATVGFLSGGNQGFRPTKAAMENSGHTFPIQAFLNVLDTDTVLTWMTRNNPGYTCALDGTDTGLVRLTLTATPTISYLYMMTAASFEVVKWMFYTPSSGPPKRSAIQDAGTTLTLVPVQY